MEKPLKVLTRILAITLALGAVTVHMPIRAELLIMKQTDAGFTALDESDNENKVKIEEILLKYQWPMSAALALAPLNERTKILAETGDLFMPDKPNAEEIWIEKKIQQETGNNSYRVVFFPTCLYELFAIIKTFESDAPNPLRKEVINLVTENFTLKDKLESNENPLTIRKNIQDYYAKYNKILFNGNNSAHDYVNQALTAWVFTNYPHLTASPHALALSDALNNESDGITYRLLTELRTMLKHNANPHEILDVNVKVRIPYRIARMLYNPTSNTLFSIIITAEYKARQFNKALLIRGTSFSQFKTMDTDISHHEKYLIATTVYGNENFEQAYKEHKSAPYSISFGNSLLAGSLRDESASAYYWLEYRRAGYALFVNKKDYITTNNEDLFFIAPFSTLTALFGEGEWFHPRTKIPLGEKSEFTSTQEVGGLKGHVMTIDPANIISVKKDPLKHAILFSQFVTDNSYIIQLNGEYDPEKLMEIQKEATQYYKGIKGMKPMWETTLPRVRKNIAERKATKTATQE